MKTLILLLASLPLWAQPMWTSGASVPTSCSTYGAIYYLRPSGLMHVCNGKEFVSATNPNAVLKDADGNVSIGATVLGSKALSHAPSTTAVVAGGYTAAVAGDGNWGGGTTSREFITVGQAWRIRQSGTVRGIKLYIFAKGASLTAFYLKVWRYNGSTYDLVATSENALSKLTAHQLNTVTFSSPITGVQEGDYIGYRYEFSGADPGYPFSALTAQTGVTTYYQTDQAAAASGTNWAAASASAGVAVPINVLMYAPDVVGIGDSITAGHPAHYSFLETAATTDFTSEYPRLLGNLLGWSYQNMGIGSETCTNIEARFAADVVALAPSAVVIGCGVNDIAGGTAQATTIAKYTAMLNAAQAAGIKPIVALVAPWTNGTNVQMQARDALNTALTTLAANYSSAIVVNFDAAMGKNRAAGDAGNLWDIKDAYNADGVHFNAAGYAAYAQAIYAKVISMGAPVASLVCGGSGAKITGMIGGVVTGALCN